MPSQKNSVAKTTSNNSVSRRRIKTALLKARIRKFWWLFPLLGVILTIGGISVMRLQNRTKSQTQSSTNSLPVAVTQAALEPLKAWISSEGTVQAVKLKHLTFDVEGEVTYIAKRDSGRILRPGDRVKKGELLARVDDRNAVANVNKALAAIVEAQKQKSAAAATVAQAQAQVAQAVAQVRQKQAQVLKARSELNLAQTQMQRYQRIYEQGVISADDFDTRSVAVDNAKAQVIAAQAGVASAEKQVESARAEVEAAQEKVAAASSGIVNARSQLTQAKVALEGSRLYAPFNGVVAYRNIREGETFDPQLVNSQLGGDYQGILDRVPMVIVDPSLLEVNIDIAAENRKLVRPGQTAIIADKTNPETIINRDNNQVLIEALKAKGKVFAVNPVVSPGTRSIQATIRIAEGGMTLQHGERVTSWITVAGKLRTLVAPLNAFVFRDQKPYIFVVNPKKGIVEERAVDIGITGISKREIINGVEPGESIVVEGQSRLVDGTPVKVVRKVNYPSPSLPGIGE